MSVFGKIKKVLEKNDSCVVSRGGVRSYVVMRWDKWKDVSNDLKEFEKIRKNKNINLDEDENDYDVDINKIPV